MDRACDDFVETFWIGGKYSVVLYLYGIVYGRYGGVSSLK